MTALKVIGVILLVFLLIGFVRLGAVVTFGDGLRVRLRVGALRLTIYPRKPRKKKASKPKAEQPEEAAGEKKPKAKKKRSIPRPTPEELLDLADTAFTALGATVRRACHRVRIDPLELTAVFGGWDPAQAAVLYGAANTLMYAVMPRAEETFDVPDPSLHLRLNYDQEGITARGTLGVSLRVCDLFAIAFTLVIPMARWFLRFKRAHRRDKTAAEGHIQERVQTEKQSA